MYTPNYQISNRLLNYIVKLEVEKATSEKDSLAYNLRSKLIDKTKALNLFHLSHMLGQEVTLRDSEKLVEGRKLAIDDESQKVLTNFRNVLEYNYASAGDGLPLDLATLLHVNKIVLSEWRESWDVKLRTAADLATELPDAWAAVRTSASADTLHSDLKDLMDWYNVSAGQVNDLVRAGVLLYRMVELQPYASANRLTIMALLDLCLNRTGYIVPTYLPIVRLFDLHTEEFMAIWQITAQTYDLSAWLEKFTSIMLKEMQESKSDADRLLTEEQEKSSKQPFLDLNKRQLKVLRYLQTIPTVKREDYCQMMDVSTMTAFRDLNDLVRKKLIRTEGRGRGTKYKLASR